MWGEHGVGDRGTWRDVRPPASLPGESRMERMERAKRLKQAKLEGCGDGTGMGVESIESLPLVAKEEPKLKT